MNLKIVTNTENFRNELEDVVRAFEPYVSLQPDGEELTANLFVDEKRAVKTEIKIKDYPTISREYELDPSWGPLLIKRNLKRCLKRDFYDFMSNLTKKNLAYGSLTGIRPTKLYYELLSEGKDPHRELTEYFRVSDRKARLLDDIIQAQKGIYLAETEKADFFVNIPFCPSRCHYCSFISEVINPKNNRLPAYVDALCRDISAVTLRKARRAVYVGGGTPTSLPAELLERVLREIAARGEEFTVEAGRPDTLTEEKIAVMKECGVTRLSVNPQTFKQETLDIIGRRHTVEDIFRTYDLVRKCGDFDVNMDFITMLPGETFEDFKSSIDTAISLAPENITVHSLSIKRGSVFAENNYDNFSDELSLEMSDYAFDALEKAGYRPYYTYRQKNTSGRLENIGYARPGKECKYNIDIMEETHDIYASGAGAISKRLFGDGLIKRLAEVKDIKGYLERIDEMIEKKIAFFAE
ncbi:MAG: coproporphyrinogen dehydrogenase HemZ [Clostridia bacterium]|nr:coproporphyrinogen dehydrogenase HemZ [Clostridia bacterium]